MSKGILTSGWLPLAHLLRPQGRRGELLADPLSDLPELFIAGREVTLTGAGSAEPAPGASVMRIEEHWFPTGKNSGRIVLKLSGCDSISDAEALAGRDLLISSSEIPPLDADTFFVGDLVGCTLYDGETAVGTIVDLEFATGPDGRTRLEDAAPLFAVQPSGSNPELAEPTLVPFVRAWLDSVDVAGRRITMHLPPGLFDPTELPSESS